MDINQALKPWNSIPKITYNPVLYTADTEDFLLPNYSLEEIPKESTKKEDSTSDKKAEESIKLTTIGDIYGFNGWKFEAPKKESSSNLSITPITVKGSQTFEDAYNSYLSKHPEDADTRNILTAIAGLESGYNNKIKNPISSATGYFQFLDGTAKQYGTKVDVNNPESQIDLAVKHYRSLDKLLKSRKTKIKQSGLTPLQVMYGMWWRPKSMLNYLDKGSDDYVNAKDKMTLLKILNRAKQNG